MALQDKMGELLFDGNIPVKVYAWKSDAGKDSVYMTLGEGCSLWTSRKNAMHLTEPVGRKAQAAVVPEKPKTIVRKASGTPAPIQETKVVTKKGDSKTTKVVKPLGTGKGATSSKGWTIE
jgi:hypothetical protein